MFWLLNKETNTPDIFGSVSAISKHTGISVNTLYNYFSRKNIEFENNTYRIVKCKVRRSFRNNGG